MIIPSKSFFFSLFFLFLITHGSFLNAAPPEFREEDGELFITARIPFASQHLPIHSLFLRTIQKKDITLEDGTIGPLAKLRADEEQMKYLRQCSLINYHLLLQRLIRLLLEREWKKIQDLQIIEKKPHNPS